MAENIKWVETRGRRSPWHVGIGQRVAIHAAVKDPLSTATPAGECMLDGLGRLFFSLNEPFTEDQQVQRGLAPDGDLYGFPLPLGAVLATGQLTDVVPITGDFGDEFVAVAGDHFFHHETEKNDRWWEWSRVEGKAFHADEATERIVPQLPFGDFQPGRSLLLFGDIVRVPVPIPCVGHQGLWTLPADIAEQVTA